MRTSQCEPVVEDVERLSGSRARARRTRLTPSALGEGACERLAHRPGGREEDVLLAREVGRRSCASNNARACSLGDQCDARREPSSSKIDGSTSGRPRMEPLWSPVVATGGNRSQIQRPQEPQKQPKTVAMRCDQLLFGAHGKEGVDGSSPSEGSAKVLQSGFSDRAKLHTLQCAVSTRRRCASASART